MKVEIAIMQDRLVEFNARKDNLNQKIENFLQKNEDSRLDITEQITRMDNLAIEDYAKKISWMKKTDAEEKRTLNEFLLAFQGKERDSSGDRRSPMNSRRGRYNQRPPRSNRW